MKLHEMSRDEIVSRLHDEKKTLARYEEEVEESKMVVSELTYELSRRDSQDEPPAPPGSHFAVHQALRRMAKKYGDGYSCPRCGYTGNDDDPLSEI